MHRPPQTENKHQTISIILQSPKIMDSKGFVMLPFVFLPASGVWSNPAGSRHGTTWSTLQLLANSFVSSRLRFLFLQPWCVWLFWTQLWRWWLIPQPFCSYSHPGTFIGCRLDRTQHFWSCCLQRWFFWLKLSSEFKKRFGVVVVVPTLL